MYAAISFQRNQLQGRPCNFSLLGCCLGIGFLCMQRIAFNSFPLSTEQSLPNPTCVSGVKGRSSPCNLLSLPEESTAPNSLHFPSLLRGPRDNFPAEDKLQLLSGIGLFKTYHTHTRPWKEAMSPFAQACAVHHLRTAAACCQPTDREGGVAD